MPKRQADMMTLAKRGAEARLQDIIHEAKLLMEMFPHLRDSFNKDELPISFILAKGSGQLTRRGTKRPAPGKRPRAPRTRR